MHAQTITNMMYSLALFEYLPNRDTMERLEDLCMRALRDPDDDTSPYIWSNLLWAFGALKYKPSEDFFAAYNARSLTLVRKFNDQGVSNMLLTYASLDVHPGRELLDAFADACAELMDVFTPQGVANTLWAGWCDSRKSIDP